jgi:hypothetical protein
LRKGGRRAERSGVRIAAQDGFGAPDGGIDGLRRRYPDPESRDGRVRLLETLVQPLAFGTADEVKRELAFLAGRQTTFNARCHDASRGLMVLDTHRAIPRIPLVRCV